MDYVGLKWYKCDFHLHTMCSQCYPNNDTVEAWLDEVCKKELKCIAVTDHNDYRYIDIIKKTAEKKNIVVFPGVEVTCDSAKIHILILFDHDKCGDDVRDFLTSIGINKRAVENHEVTSESVFNVCLEAKKIGCIVIPAHIDEFNSICEISDNNIRKLLSSQYIDAVQSVNCDIWEQYDNNYLNLIQKKYHNKEITDEDVTKWKKAYIKAKEANIPIIMSSDNPRSEFDSKHGLWGIAKNYSWIKLGDNPNLEGVRQALLSYEDRIKLSYNCKFTPESLPNMWIKSIKIDKTIINPHQEIKACFNPQLNTIIGGRGSGKSSLIRCITGILRSGNFNNLTSIQDEQNNFYKHKDKKNLGIFQNNSSVNILLYKNNILYQINEKFNSKTSDLTISRYNESLKEWEVLPDNSYIEILNINSYTQKQIYELAQTPNALSELIDKNNLSLNELKTESFRCKNNLIDKIKEIRIAKEKIRNESKLKLELQDIVEQIDTFKQTGITNAIDKKNQFDNEYKEISLYLETIQKIADEISNWKSSKQLVFPNENLTDEVKDLLTKGKSFTEAAIQDISEIGKNMLQKYMSLVDDINNTRWYANYQIASKDYNEAKTKLEHQQLEVNKLDYLLKQQNLKEEELECISRLKKDLIQLEKDKNNLEKKYNNSLKNIRVNKIGYIRKIMNDINDVKIEYIEHANQKSVEDFLLHYIQSPSATVMDDITNTAKKAVQKGGLKKIKTDISKIKSGENISTFSTYFQKTIKKLDYNIIDQIMAFVPEDELQVSYKRSDGKFIPLITASPGQKTAAILSFILAYGDKILLLDQPEDDLDNRLVYDLVVKQLKKSKTNRQIIVVTHNANIPVNGDAEHIISMDSSSRYINIKHTGSIDDLTIKEEICDVMEGTEFAFKMRAKKYHLKQDNI